jgi:hypothetical protein
MAKSNPGMASIELASHIIDRSVHPPNEEATNPANIPTPTVIIVASKDATGLNLPP